MCIPHAEHVIRSELLSLLVPVAHVRSFLPTAVCCSSAENIRWSKLIDSFFAPHAELELDHPLE